MKKIMKNDLVADHNKYAYKCLKCGAELESHDNDSAWDNIDLDRLEYHYCDNCGIMFEYYYSLDLVQYSDDDGDQFRVRFTNAPDNRHIEIEDVEGEWVLPEEAFGK